MDTPVLSKRQQKKVLWGSKNKETIKNVLGTPYSNFWPLLTEEDQNSLHDVLRTYLPKLKEKKVSVPWIELKHIPCENRKEYRLQYSKGDTSLPANEKSGMVFGVNEVTKLLEKSNVSSILLASDVDPQFMIRHVTEMSVLRNVPMLIVPKLREILKEKAGISSIAVAFKSDFSIDSKLWVIDQKIKEIYLNYPVPVNHINYYRCRKELNLGEEVTYTDENTSEMEVDSDQDPSSDEKDFYLLRTSKKHRIFNPGLDTQEYEAQNANVSVDFIAFSSDDMEQSYKHNRKSTYNPLIVKQIRSDKNRNKKKIQLLKMKSRIKNI